MAVATIKHINPERMFDFYSTIDPKALSRRLLAQREYKIYGTMGVPGKSGEDVAEEVFDLTNNPSRQKEREELYGEGRSVSVGDIVNVDGVDYVCLNVGWEAL